MGSNLIIVVFAVVVFVIMAIVLLVRPAGLFGKV